MRRVLVVALLLGCGGSDTYQGPPEAGYGVMLGRVFCAEPDRTTHLAAGGDVTVCEWDCASHEGETGAVRAMFQYDGGRMIRAEYSVTPVAGCQ
jgi:hypothetical protein